MAEKKKRKSEGSVSRKGILIRLPEWHESPLKKLKERYRRPTTTEVTIALEEYYAKHGVGSSS